MSNFLYEQLANVFNLTGNKPTIPDEIKNNMPEKFKIRDYQKEALQYFIFNYNRPNRCQIWNLFHMATGAGKTNIMAMLILYLYSKGYRNYIFLVNATNIVEKTKDNFLNKESKKYLFAKQINFDGKNIEINSVENFKDIDDEDVNIFFTTIQGLHDKLTTQRENNISYEDFKDEKFVIIADEAHHFNASTSKKKDEVNDAKTWEDTITTIWKTNQENILLEFTATCDLSNPEILKKYQGQPADIIYNYPILEFRNSGYTKELMNLRTTLSPMEKTLQAMLLSQYRLKIFEKNNIANTKPVVLLKAYDTTAKLDEIYEEYIDFIENKISENNIANIRNQATDIVKRMFDYFDSNEISDDILINELKQSFSKNNVVKIHSKISNLDELQIKLNSLENKENPIRMVITLDMLHEGWDVLNLFDIVRLTDKRQGGKNVGPTTIKEAQLIGRGARYFPYEYEDRDKYKRKFDNDLNNEMRVCETLYYHCCDDNKYISEIKKALKETGFEFREPEHSFTYKVKPEFKDTDTYKNGKLFVNRKIKKQNLNSELPSVSVLSFVKDARKTTKISSLYDDDNASNSSAQSYNYKISELAEKHSNLLLKAMRQFPVYRFNVLKKYFPELTKIEDFVFSDKYAGKYEFSIVGQEEPTLLEIYDEVKEIFGKLSYTIKKLDECYEGTKEFNEIALKDIVKDRERHKLLTSEELRNHIGEGISQNAIQIPMEFRLDLANNDWFVYKDNFGTPEEKKFVSYFASKVEKLKEKYEHVYLIRNEEVLKIYSFDTGEGFEPDYILILQNNDGTFEQQQIFIEPKGDGFIANDQWKEDFLLSLEHNASIKDYSNEEYKILGLPFFNANNNQSFENEFNKLINKDEA